MKTVYIYSDMGSYVGAYVCQESPLEDGVYITPTKSTEIEPPTFTELETCTWDGAEWVVNVIPIIVEPTPQFITPIVPTATELMAKLVAIQSQIQALV